MKSTDSLTQKKNEQGVLQIIGSSVAKNPLLAIGIVITVCGAIGAALLPPIILGHIVDDLTAGQTILFSAVLLYFGLTALTGLLEAAREFFLTVFGQKITHAIRSRLMEKFTRLTADGLNQQDPGTLVSRFVGDVDTVENLFTSGIISMFADACKIISILAVIWVQNRGLALVLVVLLPFLFWFTRYVQKNMLAAQLDNRRAVARVSGHVPQTLHNIRTIHSLGKETYMEQRYDTYIGQSYQAMERTNFYDAIYSPVILILNAIVVALVMLLSASGNASVLALFGMSAGTAVTIVNYISQIFTPIESLGMEIQTIQSALAGVHRINEFLALEELPDVPKASVSNHSEKDSDFPFVSVENISFAYDEQPVLKDLSFSVSQGEQVTLSGRTGAGKSTVFKLLLGLYPPQKGSVRIDGIATTDIPEQDRRALYGYVEQSFHLVPGTVRDQITLFDPSISEQQVHDAAVLAGLEESISHLPEGYDTVCTPELFSQGQWQLLSIARAAAASPRLLLLDEITANLDAETEHTVLEALKRVSENRTVLSISHRYAAETGRVIHLPSLSVDAES